jgi:DNA-directed RNA polymerase specialized sigma24 family protein
MVKKGIPIFKSSQEMTPKEREYLYLLVERMEDEKIADKMGISLTVVRIYYSQAIVRLDLYRPKREEVVAGISRILERSD